MSLDSIKADKVLLTVVAGKSIIAVIDVLFSLFFLEVLAATATKESHHLYIKEDLIAY